MWRDLHLPEDCSREYSFLTEAQIHRKVWVAMDLKNHGVSTPLPWARLPSTRSGCPSSP